MNYAEVVVNRPIRRRAPKLTDDTRWEPTTYAETHLKTFHYHIPPQLQNRIQPGHLVSVPFRHQMVQGIVAALSETSPVPKTRPIEAILDPLPVVSAPQMALARWLAAEYPAPLATCLNYFLPPGANRRPVQVIEIIDAPAAAPALTPLEQALFLYLQKKDKPVPVDEVDAVALAGLIQKKLVRKRATLARPRVGPRFEQTAELLIAPEMIDDALARLGRSSKQANILVALMGLDDPLPSVESVRKMVGCTISPFKALAEKGWIRLLPAQTMLAPAPAVDWQNLPPGLSDRQRAFLNRLRAENRPVDPKQADPNPPLSVAEQNALVEAGLAVRFDEPGRLALGLDYAAAPQAVISLRRLERHAAALHLLAEEDGPVWVGWIFAQTEATQKTLQDLARIEAIALNQTRRWRDPLAGKAFTLSRAPRLTPEQAEIMQTILPAMQQHGKPFLIHGVTGSGKTEIYLQAIERVLNRGQGVVFLVPEVMLATQIVDRVRARFPQKVAVWHSALSPGERFDTWERVRNGELPIVVGPRSALFAPVRRLGLVVIDEEHEPAYKQDRAPTFHARDAAIKLARLHNAPVIMGSATPDVVTYRKAQRGEYHLLTLPNRILAHSRHVAVQKAMLRQHRAGSRMTGPPPGGAFVSLPLPPVEIVDLREELKAGNRTIFSRALAEGIRQTLARGEQVILFLNRRGTATFVICRDCGYVMRCPRCDTTLTFHNPTDRLVCHYCGHRTAIPPSCPACRSARIRYFGLGTERVEAALQRTFPQARPIRLDQDTTRKRGSHYTFLQHFIEGRANVMIGTQMVAKGLDLPLVTLVGVISADTALYLPEFRAAERTFQVLMQVAGRAGRSPLGGRVILQTYTPEQPAILAAAAHDYLTFYQAELQFRYEQGYPPFKRLARLLYSGNGQAHTQAAAQAMADRLRLWVDRQGFPAVEIVGPTPAYVPRIGSRYRRQILVRAPNPVQVLGPIPLPLGWKIDIDPVNLL